MEKSMHERHIAFFLSACLASCGGSLNTTGGADGSTDDPDADVAAEVSDEVVDVSGEAEDDPTPEPTVDVTVDVAPEPVEEPLTDPTPECGTDGALLYGICWYLGSAGQDCFEVCGSHGGYDDDTPEYVGTPSQGGSVEECEAIFEALGYTDTVSPGYREDGRGLGCHRWSDGSLWWLDSPDFDPSDSMEPSQAVCGCEA
jgi:hypothetical protein